MNQYSVTSAKAHFSEILAKAEAGQEVVITRRGTPVARISGTARRRRPLDFAAIDAFRGGLPPQGQRSSELIRRLRDEKY